MERGEPTIPADWIAEAQNGSDEAIGRILEACRDDLVRLAQAGIAADLRAKGAASDIVQETMLEACRDLSQFSGRTDGELRAWLRRILTNNLQNFARQFREAGKRNVRREMPMDAAPPEGLALSTPSPSGKAGAAEEAAALEKAIGELPDDYRQVILRREREKESFAEIATALGRSEDAVRKLWFRAIRKLRETLGGPT